MRNISIGPTDGGAGVSELALALYATLVNTATAVAYTVRNAKSPVLVEVLDLANGNNTINVPQNPRRCGGVIIAPPEVATHRATLRGATGDTGIVLHENGPALLCFSNSAYPTQLVLNWSGPTLAAGTSLTVDPATDTFTLSNHGLADGSRVRFMATTMPGGLLPDIWYYVRDSATNTFKVTTVAGGTAVDVTSAGTGLSVTYANRFNLFWF